MAAKKRPIKISPKKEGTLTAIAKRENGLTKSGKISRAWANKKLASPKTRESTKKKIRFFLNMNKRRKNNPTVSTARQVEKAIQLFMRFKEEEPRFVDEIDYAVPKVGMVIGDLDGVLYTTRRGGKVEHYKHEFTGRSKPLLAASWDGKTIFIVGGHYNFTEDGIKDK